MAGMNSSEDFSIELYNVFASQYLTDILTVGYADLDEGFCKYRPILEHIYLEFESCYIRCASVQQYSGVEITIDKQLRLQSNFEIDEDDQFCASSVYELLIGMNLKNSNFVRKVRYYVDPLQNLNKNLFLALELELERGCIFLDPMNIYGFLVSNRSSIVNWREMHSPAFSIGELKTVEITRDILK